MENPGGFTKKQQSYIDYLEKKIEDFASTKTKVKSYYALKKTVDDLNDLMLNGIELEVQETIEGREETRLKSFDLLSSRTLSNKDDRIFDRFFKFIDKIEYFLSTMDKLTDQISPELIKEDSYASDYEKVMEKINSSVND